MNRLRFGFDSVLAPRDARVDHAPVEARFLREAGVAALAQSQILQMNCPGTM